MGWLLWLAAAATATASTALLRSAQPATAPIRSVPPLLKALMMNMRPLFCLLVGLALLPAQGNAQGAAPGNAPAQEFQIQEKASLTAVPVAELKPRTIVFADQPGANKDEVFVSYEDWPKPSRFTNRLWTIHPASE